MASTSDEQNRSTPHPEDGASALARRAELVLARLEGLPTLSPIATRLLSLGASDDVDMGEVVSLIESDPALTARILGLTRKATHGLGDKIQSVKHAAMMVGMGTIRTTVLGVEVYDLLNERAEAVDQSPCRGTDVEGAGGARREVSFDRSGFWKYSLAVGCAAELISRAHRVPGIRPEEAFVAGLLHGVGKLALEITMPQSSRRALALAERRRGDLAGAERDVLGLDHHRAGKRIAERWGLPEALRDVMWMHGQTPESVPQMPRRDLVLLVTLASWTVRRMHIGWPAEFDAAPATDGVCTALGIAADVEAMLTPALHEAVAERCATLGLEDETSASLLTESMMNANRSLSRIAREAESRARTAQHRAVALDAVEGFLSPQRGDQIEGVAVEIERVAESFVASVGPGFLAAAVRSDTDPTWLGVVFNAKGHVRDTVDLGGVIEHEPVVGSDVPRLGRAIGVGERPDWVSALLHENPDIPGIRTTTLGRSGDGYEAILVHEASPEGQSIGAAGYESLAGVWSWWLRAASRAEHAVRAGEALADANRALASTREKLAEAEALARLGEVTAGAAHEMNNPLTIIMARSQQLGRLALDRKERAAAHAISSAAGDLADLIVSLHLIATDPQPRLAPTDPGEIIQLAMRRLTGKLEAMELRRVRTRAEATPSSMLDRDMLSHALSELIRNGIESGSDAQVEVALVPDAMGDRLTYFVLDSGRGVSDKALKHAFDPFFSEHPAGRQTGMGLSRARRLVEAHGGRVWLERIASGGTAAYLSVPLELASTGIAGGATPPAPGHVGRAA